MRCTLVTLLLVSSQLRFEAINSLLLLLSSIDRICGLDDLFVDVNVHSGRDSREDIQRSGVKTTKTTKMTKMTSASLCD